MDIVTYALCKGAVADAVSSILPGFTYKGTASTVADLPASGTGGDLYIVGGSDIYVWDGSAWVLLSITSAQIDALFE